MHFFQIDDAQPDVDDVVNYPNVRSFFTALEYSSEPQYDLVRVQRTWVEPTPGIFFLKFKYPGSAFEYENKYSELLATLLILTHYLMGYII